MKTTTWARYSENFATHAMHNGFSPEEIDGCLTYAHNLYKQKLPIIYDQEHFALLEQISN